MKTTNVKIWGGTHEAYADAEGVVRVYDPVAGHFTTCHSLTEGQVRRVRALASESPAATLGRKGGQANTAAQNAARRENAKKGGRPRVFFPVETIDGPTRRIKLPPVQWEGKAGALRALYCGNNFSRQIAKLEEDGATVYRELDNSSFQGFAEMAGITKKL